MSEPDKVSFTPTEESRAIFRELGDKLGDAANSEFFKLWEAESAEPDAPRRAASVVANAYMLMAARYAVFGTICSGREPKLEQWLKLAEEQFHRAVADVTMAGSVAAVIREEIQT